MLAVSILRVLMDHVHLDPYIPWYSQHGEKPLVDLSFPHVPPSLLSTSLWL